MPPKKKDGKPPSNRKTPRNNDPISVEESQDLTKSSMSDEFYKFITSDKVKQLRSEAVKIIIYAFITFAAAETFGRVGGEAMGRRIAAEEAITAENQRTQFENTLRELNISPIQAEFPDLRFAEATAEVIPQRATAENITGTFYY
jgi:hypothetical protein